jgi:hypothetical protein
MKSFAAILIGCLAVFNTPQVGAQQPTMTQLVPKNAAYALVFRNVNELKERGDEFAEEMGFKGGVSTLFSIVGSQLMVSGAAFDESPCGIMWFEPELIGEAEVKQAWKKPVAVGVAISDTKALAESLNVDHDELLAGKIVERDHSNFGHKHRYYRMVDRYLWIVSHEKLYDVLKKSQPLANAIPRSRLAEIDAADCLLSVSAKSAELRRDTAEEEAEKWIESHKELDPAEEDAIRNMFSVLSAATHAVVAARVDRGLEFSFNIFFGQDAPPEVRQRILKLSPPDEGVSLAGLPSNDLLFGISARTDASEIQPALTAMVRESRGIWWLGWRPMLDQKFVSQFEQLKLLGLFGEIWPLTNRYNVGIYQEENAAAHGLISMASIFETDRPDVLMSELQSLAAIVDRTAMGSVDSDADREEVQALVRSLIKQLSDDEFQQRQSATTRLVLIGEPALPLVIVAKLSKNSEVAKRATQIAKMIREELEQKQAAALKSSVLANAKPVFIFHPDAEERAGASIDVMEVRVKEGSELRALLPVLVGKEWSRIRLVKFGKHVAVFFGSNLERLDEMIRNVQAIERGEEVDVPETSYGTPLLKMRGGECQGSVSRVLRLMKHQRLTGMEPDDKNDPELSSISVTLEPDFFTVEWRLSLPDLKVIRKIGF